MQATRKRGDTHTLAGRAGPDDICAAGRLILVTCADSGRLDLVLRAACRRLGADARFTLIEAVGTRRQPAGGGVIVSRSAFASLDRAGALALVWQRDGASFGHSVNLLARLALGENIVAAAPLEAEKRVRETWANLHIIRLESGTERLRSGLAPLNPPRMGAALVRLGSVTDRSYDMRLTDSGDLGATVRLLAASIDTSLPPHAPRTAPAIAPRRATAAAIAGKRGGIKATETPDAPLPRLARPRRRERGLLDAARRKAI